MRIPELQRTLVEAARRQERSRRRSRRLGRRPLVLLAVLVLGGATGALAAAGVFRTGAPVPASRTPEADLLVGGSWKLLSVRAPDPAGGPPWAIRLVFYKRAALYGPALCTQFGRVVDGRFGLLGQDGLFGDDGLFHPADIASYGDDGCGGGTPGPRTLSASSLDYTSGQGEGAASGASAGMFGCSQVAARPRSQPILAKYDRLWARQLASTVAVLRTGDAQARAMARRYGVSVASLLAADEGWLHMARAEAAGRPVTQWTYATCPTGSLRTLSYGYAGPNAVSMSISGHGFHQTEPVNRGDSGAYLFVLPGPPSRWYGESTRVTCRDGSHLWGCIPGERPCIPDQTPSHGPSQATPTAEALATLSVLRRPATVADRLPAQARSFEHSAPALVLTRYIRRARTAFGETFYLVPTIVARCKPHPPSQRFSLLVLQGQGSTFGGGPSITEIEAGQGITGSQGAPIPGTPFESSTRSFVEGIVPSGIATVTLHYPAGPANGYQHKILPAFTTTVAVVNNIVVAIVPRSAGTALPTTIIWRTRTGRTVKTIHNQRPARGAASRSPAKPAG